jgi:hypothetical protein
MMRDDMRHFENEINEFLDKELDAATQRELFKHLAECEQCMHLLEDLQTSGNSIRKYYKAIEMPEYSPLIRVKPRFFYFSAGVFRLPRTAFAIIVILLFIALYQQSQIHSKNNEIVNLRSAAPVQNTIRQGSSQLAVNSDNCPQRAMSSKKVKQSIKPRKPPLENRDTIQLYMKDLKSARFLTVDKNDLLFSYNPGK